MTGLSRVFFRLEPDDDDYPPIAAESVWATPGTTAGEYIIDNIPFFVRDATMGDTVRAHEEEGVPWFDMVVQRSSNSLMRAIFFDEDQVEDVSHRLIELGCAVEYSKAYKLLAISVPSHVRLTDVQHLLNVEATKGSLDYEEPLLRQ